MTSDQARWQSAVAALQPPLQSATAREPMFSSAVLRISRLCNSSESRHPRPKRRRWRRNPVPVCRAIAGSFVATGTWRSRAGELWINATVTKAANARAAQFDRLGPVPICVSFCTAEFLSTGKLRGAAKIHRNPSTGDSDGYGPLDHPTEY